MTRDEGIDRELAREVEQKRRRRQRLIVALIVGGAIAAFIAALAW